MERHATVNEDCRQRHADRHSHLARSEIESKSVRGEVCPRPAIGPCDYGRKAYGHIDAEKNEWQPEVVVRCIGSHVVSEQQHRGSLCKQDQGEAEPAADSQHPCPGLRQAEQNRRCGAVDRQ
jgi:hypothetical protein